MVIRNLLFLWGKKGPTLWSYPVLLENLGLGFQAYGGKMDTSEFNDT